MGEAAVGFEQAEIKIEREQEFQQLKAAIERALSPRAAEKFLGKLKSQRLRIRQWEEILAAGLIEQADPELKKSGKSAQGLYQALALSDQAQIREFYLEQVDGVSPELRRKFHTVYTMY